MREDEPPSTTDRPVWHVEEIKGFLGTEPTPHRHRVYGPGLRFDLNPLERDSWARLDLYPERLVVRYRSALVKLDVLAVSAVRVENDHHVLVESARNSVAAHLMAYPNGQVAYVQFARFEAPDH